VVPAWADYCPLILHACQLKKNDVLPFSSVDKAQAWRSLPLMEGELDFVSFISVNVFKRKIQYVRMGGEKSAKTFQVSVAGGRGFFWGGGQWKRGGVLDVKNENSFLWNRNHVNSYQQSALLPELWAAAVLYFWSEEIAHATLRREQEGRFLGALFLLSWNFPSTA
jgi:hypothetical protein